MPFLPMTTAEMQALGWKQCDFIIVTGDAYIDHPGFGAAIIGRSLEAAGYKVGIISQPDWQKDDDWLALGAPRLGFGVTSGNMDSMVNHYTAQKKLRHNDAYSPDGKFGLRPDRAVMIYTNRLRQLFKNTPVIIGGIEASLRRISHYDFWQDKVRNSILADSKADILVYGMGERQIVEIVRLLDAGNPANTIRHLPGTVVFDTPPPDAVLLPPAESCNDKLTFHAMSHTFHEHYRSAVVYQPIAGRHIRHNPPAPPLTQEELDKVYDYPYMRAPHTRYNGTTIPAWTQIKDSITSHRGCMGGCNFCTIGYHQGKAIQSRSRESILKELRTLTRTPGFKGTISDIGGPSANMYGMSCAQGYPASCMRSSCLFPTICKHLHTSHGQVISLLNQALKVPGIRHVFVASGIRFDLALTDPDYIRHIAAYHTGGLLKLAPEHTSPQALKAMGKPDIRLYLDFCELFFNASQAAGKKQQIVPYIITGHPGTTMQDAISLHQWLKTRHIHLEQVQEFTPTPMTISTCMYYTGLDYATGKPIHVPKGREIRLQKALVLWYKPENSSLVREALSSVKKA